MSATPPRHNLTGGTPKPPSFPPEQRAPTGTGLKAPPAATRSGYARALTPTPQLARILAQLLGTPIDQVYSKRSSRLPHQGTVVVSGMWDWRRTGE